LFKSAANDSSDASAGGRWITARAESRLERISDVVVSRFTDAGSLTESVGLATATCLVPGVWVPEDREMDDHTPDSPAGHSPVDLPALNTLGLNILCTVATRRLPACVHHANSSVTVAFTTSKHSTIDISVCSALP